MTAQPKPRRWQWCFSTLGCSDLTLRDICALAGEFGIPGIELRGMGCRMDMADYCAEQGLTHEWVQELCRENHTRLVMAGSSVKLTNTPEEARADLLKFTAWAEAWRIPHIRVFGGGTWGVDLEEADYLRAAELVRWWRTQRNSHGWQVDLLLETHDAFSGSDPCLRLNHSLDRPMPLIWDSHHTWRIGGESIGSTWRKLGPFIRHVHIKDSVDRPSARHPYTYVLPGTGQMPMAEVVGTLDAGGFEGFLSLEWERAWHPYLDPLRSALGDLVQQPWFSQPAHEAVTVTPAR